LYVALDLGYVTQEIFDKIYDKADQVSLMISNLIKHLRSQTHTRT
jgi:hypothetical protein